ncbi:gag protein [Ditylenchus destructor]|uniref:Gag protein n=1 Tax=Ditylenchus destructor TaxID=166010 RepID=A0AAD4N352_9BILA|nr:gag protein [Ditylenchus destructor]
MSYLVMFLRNNAKTAINGYHITHDNYPIVIELLKRRFGNQKVIGEILQQELISLPKATNATQSLRTFSDSVERLCRQMRSLQISDEHPVISSIVKSKLPYSVLTKVLERERTEGESWTAAKLRKTIQDIIDIRDSAQQRTYVCRNTSENIPEASNQRCPNNSLPHTPSHMSEKTDLFAFDAKIVAVSQETSSKCELAPTEIASEPVTEIIGRLPLSETADSSLPEISKVIEDLPIVGADIKKSDSSHDLRPIYNEQIHMQKNEEIKEHGITNQSPPKYAIHIHLNVQSDKINITLKLLHQPTNAYRKGAENSVIKNLAGTNLRTVASYLLCRGKCVLCFTRLICRCSRTRTNETSHLSTKMTTEPSLSIRNVTVLSFSNFRTDVSSRPARPPNHFLSQFSTSSSAPIKSSLLLASHYKPLAKLTRTLLNSKRKRPTKKSYKGHTKSLNTNLGLVFYRQGNVYGSTVNSFGYSQGSSSFTPIVSNYPTHSVDTFEHDLQRISGQVDTIELAREMAEKLALEGQENDTFRHMYPN